MDLQDSSIPPRHRLMAAARRRIAGANSADDLIANIDQECEGHWIKLTASDDGSFTITNGHAVQTRTAVAESGRQRH